MSESATDALRLVWLPGRFGVYRLDADAAVPDWANAGPFTSVSRSTRELSVLTAWRGSSAAEPVIGPLACFAVEGPLDFDLTGILARLTVPLAKAGISVFSVATFDTDYLLVVASEQARAQRLLEEVGMRFEGAA